MMQPLNPNSAQGRLATPFRLAFAIVLGATAVLLSGHAMAGPPSGNYEHTCKDIKVDGSTLSAKCLDDSGQYPESSLDEYGKCKTDINNHGGHLVCMPPPMIGGCQGAHWSKGDITAKCENFNRDLKEVQVQIYPDCPTGPLINLNGVLLCNFKNMSESSIKPWQQQAFSQSCGDIHATNTSVTALCLNQAGGLTAASFGICPLWLVDNNGALTCPGYTPGNTCTGPGCAVPNGQTTPEAGCSAPECPPKQNMRRR